MGKKEKWYHFKFVPLVFGIQVKFFLPIALAVVVCAAFGFLPEGFVGAFVFVMSLGGILSWIGSSTPILRAIGGQLLVPLFGTIILVGKGIFPETVIEGPKLLMSGGFQMVFVAAVVVGSILAMDRKLLLASVARYLPVLLITQIFALAFAFLAAFITGTSVYDAVFFIAAPCMSGGTSGAIATLPALYSSVLGKDMTSMGGSMYAVAMLGEYIAIIMVVVIKLLAEKFPKAMDNGQGQLLRIESKVLEDARKNQVNYEESSTDYTQLGAGLFVSGAVMVGGVLLSAIIPQVVYVAWAIIICIVLKGTGILPESLCKAAYYWSQFILKNVIIILVTSLGMSAAGGFSLSAIMNPATIIIIILTFLGAIVGAMLGSKLFKIHRYEGALTAALCQCNIGASGDLQMLILSDRVNLLAYATMSTRIGGAMVLIEISIIFPIVAKALGII